MKGKELHRMLKQAGLSRRGLSRELRIADSTVCRWIRGESPIGLLESIGLACYFERAHGIESNWKDWRATK